MGLIYYFYFLFLFLTVGLKKKIVFNLILLSIISGLANSILIFIINNSIGLDDDDRNRILMYFVFTVAIYLIGQRYVRYALVKLTNDFLDDKRKKLIDKIMSSAYENIENTVKGNIYAALNGDMKIISSSVHSVVTIMTNLITIFVCLIYLAFIHFQGFLLSLIIIIIGLTVYLIKGRVSQRFWEKNRDIQNVFYNLIDDMVLGFKDFYMHQRKRKDFHNYIIEKCSQLRNFRIKGDLNFINAYLLGELLIIIVLGVSIFLFPLLNNNFEYVATMNFIVIFLFIIGPINGLLNTIPELFQVRISWERVGSLEKELETSSKPFLESQTQNKEFNKMELEKVSYDYIGEDSFTVGPLNATFNSSEISFIVGSNGSGKSTLANLIMGLYEPSKGKIKVNGKIISSSQLGEHFSAIHSDFHLFDQLYGIKTHGREEEISRYLNVLNLNGKVSIKNNKFSTIKLSTGQRKRLALLISLLEDSPIYLFDEWAADQDPEFREFFYRRLLPDLRNKGKCIIAITHDDRYFSIANQLIKMELGKVITINSSNASK
ncbi:cyclic peptide export ABC transporter [Virgibacillus sp. NKC19-3]|uniref:cyclic peptide export ABC transporter n=1 Tax=Virgibacillus saliphilus TaxID=2831674 RepID=UPI001C9B7DB1|nr:cyclic peptide export ABC transporter [Virgibacillus sp. NKC19-3]MBY7142472.1 cyclic peptide export ABC transporter [Virgibacillus sp. NKC19-3]